MGSFRDLPIKRKMTLAVLGTTLVTLLAVCAASLAYERVIFRQAMARNLSVLAEALASNSTAALSFNNADDAADTLEALRAEPSVEAACLYNTAGSEFATYSRGRVPQVFPRHPEADGTRFEPDHLVVVRPVMLNNNRLGTLYLRADLSLLSDRLRSYAQIAGVALLASLLLAFALATALQRAITRPIFALTDTVKTIAQTRDYTARATKLGADEIGTLTDSFNQMLGAIQERDTALQRNHTLVEAIREAQSQFILGDPSRKVFDLLLGSLLKLTDSKFGFIDELFYTPEGEPYLSARAITDISWNDETRKLYPKLLTGELNFTNKKSLFGEVLTTRKVVIANDAPGDPRRGGTPPGHPTLNAFLGIPLFSNDEFIGVVGLANRPGGYTQEFAVYLEPMVNACANLLAAWRIDRRRLTAEEEIRQLNASLEERVRERTAQLETAVRELDAFSYSVSHDLRAPLRAVDGFSRMVTEDYADKLDEDGRRKLGMIRSETARMGRLIDDLLAFSRLGRQNLEQAPIDMHALAQSVFSELAAQEPERKLRLDLQQLPPARGTEAMVRQVWVNLISNAIKFTKERETGEIEIGTRDGGQTYYVKDNGAGFDMRHASKLFGVFQRLHSAAEFQGTGVGLALVQRIVQRHGGRVWADAAVNRGATFFFTLANSQP
jgi:signal transduction histidine kinase